jgi:hypothetical protein
MKDEILKKFELDNDKNKKAVDFSHSYFQGLLVEIGNIKGYQTYIPNQDKNKFFLQNPLGRISSLSNILHFSYENLIKRAQSVDVIWFNNRNMPASFFEVEHSTDFYNSLIKFSELRDFYSSFCIVADDARKMEFDKKITSFTFSEIKERINFMSYETLSQVHTNTFKLINIQKGYSFLK